jgi:hypothetical protein
MPRSLHLHLHLILVLRLPKLPNLTTIRLLWRLLDSKRLPILLPLSSPLPPLLQWMAGITISADSALAHGVLTSDIQPNAPSHASPLHWGGSPFDVGVQLTINAPLCGIESKDEDKLSDDNAIFVDLSRD